MRNIEIKIDEQQSIAYVVKSIDENMKYLGEFDCSKSSLGRVYINLPADVLKSMAFCQITITELEKE